MKRTAKCCYTKGINPKEYSLKQTRTDYQRNNGGAKNWSLTFDTVSNQNTMTQHL